MLCVNRFGSGCLLVFVCSCTSQLDAVGDPYRVDDLAVNSASAAIQTEGPAGPAPAEDGGNGNDAQPTQATAQSKNFVVTVEPANADLAKRIADQAERLRTDLATLWFGQPLADWQDPVPIHVQLRPFGAVSAAGPDKKTGKLSANIRGKADSILRTILPHELTHLIFAGFFADKEPPWAAEGIAVMAEPQEDIQRHDKITATQLAANTSLPFTKFFNMKNPVQEGDDDPNAFYAQSYSVVSFLVEKGGRPKLLQFIRDGMANGWDKAAQDNYGFKSVDELDQAWRAWFLANHPVAQPRQSN
jgi:hypothetical protein